jgi:hypothetical protein
VDVSDPALHLALALARALADGRRVMLAGDSFEAMQILAAADVRELVVVSPQAEGVETAGETAGGAPLKVRPDWAERASSKDLVVDPEGVADPEAVRRLLKKKGLYVTARPGPALEAMAHRAEVRARRFEALVVGDRPGVTVTLAEGAEGPAAWVAGPDALPVLPDVVGLVPGAAAVPVAEIEAARERVAGLERAVEAARAEGAAARLAADARAAAATTERDEARAAAAKEREAAQRAQAEVEAELEAVRAELAERRVQDRRAELVRSHFEELRRQMNAELEELRARLRDVAEPAADLESLRGERDALRDALRRVSGALAEAVGEVAGAPHEPALVDAWLERIGERRQRAVEARAAQAEATRAAEVRAREAERRLREHAEALAVLEAARSDPGPAPMLIEAAPAEELRERLAHLEATLDAERAARRGEQAELERARRAAREAVAEATALRGRIDGARRDAARARLANADAHDEVERLRGELGLRDARLGDVEAMLNEHGRMIRLLSEALDDAVRARETAEGERRLADQNLRLLRAELDRRATA